MDGWMDGWMDWDWVGSLGGVKFRAPKYGAKNKSNQSKQQMNKE